MSEAYRISALKYRPSLFADVLAQEHVTRTLKHSIQKEQIANAYIFAGPRGTGKTTTARILAKALNCTSLRDAEPCNECENCISVKKGNHPDVLEIDAASNRQVEEAEALRETTQFLPSLGQNKIYIIDECHMLSNHANNALLKTLEEPPSHVKFIFATTELQKIMPTIKSRCQLFQFRRIPVGVIVDQLKHVLKSEPGFALEDQSEFDRILYLIAQGSDGGMRDALVSMDQLIAFCSGKLNLALVEEMLGVVEFDRMQRFIGAIIRQELDIILQVIEDITNRGREIKWFLKECQHYLRNLMVIKISPNQKDLVDLPEDYYTEMMSTAEHTTIEQILYISDQLWEAERRMYFSPEARMIVEVAAIKAAKAAQASNIKDLLNQLASSGNIESPPVDIPQKEIPQKKTAPEAKIQTTSKPVTAETKPVRTFTNDAAAKPKDDRQTAAPIQKDEPPLPEPPPERGSDHGQNEKKTVRNIDAGLLESALTPPLWEAILQEIEETNPFFAHSLEDSSIQGGNGNTVKISVSPPDKMHLNQLEKSANKKQLEEKIFQKTGKQLTVKYEIQSSSQVVEEEEEDISDQDQPSRGEMMERLEQNENFQRLQEILPGKILRIRSSQSQQ